MTTTRHNNAGRVIALAAAFLAFAGMAAPSAGAASSGKTPSASHAVTKCTGGRVARKNGSCACPSGEQFSGGKCIPSNGGIVLPQAPPLIPCTGGRVALADGSCACPAGHQFSGGQCVASGGGISAVPRPQFTIQCTGGQVPQAGGSCGCPYGMRYSNGICVAYSGPPLLQPNNPGIVLPGTAIH